MLKALFLMCYLLMSIGTCTAPADSDEMQRSATAVTLKINNSADIRKSYDKFLRALRQNWNSPIQYLESRGYIPSNERYDINELTAQLQEQENALAKKSVDVHKQFRQKQQVLQQLNENDRNKFMAKFSPQSYAFQCNLNSKDERKNNAGEFEELDGAQCQAETEVTEGETASQQQYQQDLLTETDLDNLMINDDKFNGKRSTDDDDIVHSDVFDFSLKSYLQPKVTSQRSSGKQTKIRNDPSAMVSTSFLNRNTNVKVSTATTASPISFTDKNQLVNNKKIQPQKAVAATTERVATGTDGVNALKPKFKERLEIESIIPESNKKSEHLNYKLTYEKSKLGSKSTKEVDDDKILEENGLSPSTLAKLAVEAFNKRNGSPDDKSTDVNVYQDSDFMDFVQNYPYLPKSQEEDDLKAFHLRYRDKTEPMRENVRILEKKTLSKSYDNDLEKFMKSEQKVSDRVRDYLMDLNKLYHYDTEDVKLLPPEDAERKEKAREEQYMVSYNNALDGVRKEMHRNIKELEAKATTNGNIQLKAMATGDSKVLRDNANFLGLKNKQEKPAMDTCDKLIFEKNYNFVHPKKDSVEPPVIGKQTTPLENLDNAMDFDELQVPKNSKSKTKNANSVFDAVGEDADKVGTAMKKTIVNGVDLQYSKWHPPKPDYYESKFIMQYPPSHSMPKTNKIREHKIIKQNSRIPSPIALEKMKQLTNDINLNSNLQTTSSQYIKPHKDTAPKSALVNAESPSNKIKKTIIGLNSKYYRKWVPLKFETTEYDFVRSYPVKQTSKVEVMPSSNLDEFPVKPIVIQPLRTDSVYAETRDLPAKENVRPSNRIIEIKPHPDINKLFPLKIGASEHATTTIEGQPRKLFPLKKDDSILQNIKNKIVGLFAGKKGDNVGPVSVKSINHEALPDLRKRIETLEKSVGIVKPMPRRSLNLENRYESYDYHDNDNDDSDADNDLSDNNNFNDMDYDFNTN